MSHKGVSQKTVYIPIHVVKTTFALGIYPDLNQAKTAILAWISKKHPQIVEEYEEACERGLLNKPLIDAILDENDEDFDKHGIHFTILETQFGQLFEFYDYLDWNLQNLHYLLCHLLESQYCDNMADIFESLLGK